MSMSETRGNLSCNGLPQLLCQQGLSLVQLYIMAEPVLCRVVQPTIPIGWTLVNSPPNQHAFLLYFQFSTSIICLSPTSPKSSQHLPTHHNLDLELLRYHILFDLFVLGSSNKPFWRFPRYAGIPNQRISHLVVKHLWLREMSFFPSITTNSKWNWKQFM